MQEICVQDSASDRLRVDYCKSAPCSGSQFAQFEMGIIILVDSRVNQA